MYYGLLNQKISHRSVRFYGFINRLPLQFVEGGTPEPQAQDEDLPILQDTSHRIRHNFICPHLPSRILQCSPLLSSESFSYSITPIPTVQFFEQDNARKFPRPLRTILHASTLILTLPQVLIKIPTIPLPFKSRHVKDASLSHLISALVVFSFAVGTIQFFYVLSNATLVYILAGTYLLPGEQPFFPA